MADLNAMEERTIASLAWLFRLGSIPALIKTKKKRAKSKCQHCPAVFKYLSHLYAHTKAVHSEENPYKCKFCTKCFKGRHSLRSHLTVHQEEIKCPLCPKSFHHRGNLRRHIKCHDGERSFQCDYCERAFFQKVNLESHIKTHSRELVKCTECGMGFPLLRSLKKHKREVHEPPSSSRFECSQCGKSYSSRHNLQHHVKAIHEGIKPYKCLKCDQCFYSSTKLKIHYSVHTEEEPFSCVECGMKFKYMCSIKKHIASAHTNEKQFPCTACSASFSNSRHLTMHLKKVHPA